MKTPNLSDEQENLIPAQTLCPSAPPYGENAVIFGVVLGTPERAQIKYLAETQPASVEILALAGSADPGEIFRVAAPCKKRRCLHFDGANCGLAKRAVQILPVVSQTLPACSIRSSCQWWHQEGEAACQRCPQVVTLTRNLSPEYQSLIPLEENNHV